MASGSRSRLALVVFLTTLLAAHAVPMRGAWEKRGEWDHKHPKTLVLYGQELRGSHSDANFRYIVNGTLGILAIVAGMPLTATADANSTQLGVQYGQVTSFNEIVNGEIWLYGSFDMRITTKHYNGTFLLQGSYNVFTANRTIAIIGGTGDFHQAKGYAITSTSNIQDGGCCREYSDALRYECHFTY